MIKIKSKIGILLKGIKYDYPEKYNKCYGTAQCKRENEEIRKILKKYIKKGKIIDIGCGTGLGYELLEKPNDYIGIDKEGDMVRYCSSRYKEGIFYHIKAEDYIRNLKTIDNIISIWSLDYMNPELLIEIKNKLKGIFIAIHYNHPYNEPQNSSVYAGKFMKIYYLLRLWKKKKKILKIFKELGAETRNLLNEDYSYITILKGKVTNGM